MSIRLRHPTLRNCTFAVVHHRMLREPMFCASCGMMHEHKTYHLRLDARGEVVVSEEVYERLRELDGLPLRSVGREHRPEPQVLIIHDIRNGGVLPHPEPMKLFYPKGVG